MVVIAIMGVLMGMLLGGVQKVRTAAARIVCTNNLRNIGFDLQHVADATDGTYPLISNLPTPNPKNLPTLRELLGNKNDGGGKQYQCPMDLTYYAKYGNSYDFNVRDFNRRGKGYSVAQVAARKNTGSDKVWVLEDFTSVHAPPFSGRGYNVLYGDGHVSNVQGIGGP